MKKLSLSDRLKLAVKEGSDALKNLGTGPSLVHNVGGGTVGDLPSRASSRSIAGGPVARHHSQQQQFDDGSADDRSQVRLNNIKYSVDDRPAFVLRPAL